MGKSDFLTIHLIQLKIELTLIFYSIAQFDRSLIEVTLSLNATSKRY